MLRSDDMSLYIFYFNRDSAYYCLREFGYNKIVHLLELTNKGSNELRVLERIGIRLKYLQEELQNENSICDDIDEKELECNNVYYNEVKTNYNDYNQRNKVNHSNSVNDSITNSSIDNKTNFSIDSKTNFSIDNKTNSSIDDQTNTRKINQQSLYHEYNKMESNTQNYNKMESNTKNYNSPTQQYISNYNKSQYVSENQPTSFYSLESLQKEIDKHYNRLAHIKNIHKATTNSLITINQDLNALSDLDWYLSQASPPELVDECKTNLQYVCCIIPFTKAQLLRKVLMNKLRYNIILDIHQHSTYYTYLIFTHGTTALKKIIDICDSLGARLIKDIHKQTKFTMQTKLDEVNTINYNNKLRMKAELINLRKTIGELEMNYTREFRIYKAMSKLQVEDNLVICQGFVRDIDRERLELIVDRLKAKVFIGAEVIRRYGSGCKTEKEDLVNIEITNRNNQSKLSKKEESFNKDRDETGKNKQEELCKNNQEDLCKNKQEELFKNKQEKFYKNKQEELFKNEDRLSNKENLSLNNLQENKSESSVKDNDNIYNQNLFNKNYTENLENSNSHNFSENSKNQNIAENNLSLQNLTKNNELSNHAKNTQLQNSTKNTQLQNNKLKTTTIEIEDIPIQKPSTPPTSFYTDKFTVAFQDIANVYGIPAYKEINPALFYICTFPFMFGCMFGDLGHGLILFLISFYFIKYERTIKVPESITMLFTGRYIMLLCSLWGMFFGVMYTDFLSLPFQVFKSNSNLANRSLQESNIGSYTDYIYPIGIDPIWHHSTNGMMFINSVKMKLSIILGFTHMLIGSIISLLNIIYHKKIIDFYCVWIPQTLSFVFFTGYIVFLIFYKWFTGINKSLISILVNMFVQPFLNEEIFMYQKQVQLMLLCVIVCCIPWMLLTKPILETIHLRRKNNEEYENISIRDDQNKVITEIKQTKSKEIKEKVSIVDIWMHQGIDTIEFCIGLISNTSSYLRLWAISLAHTQLTGVLHKMTIGKPGIMKIVTFPVYIGATLSLLVGLEGLSSCLHALRLNWIEFNGKFYGGGGYLFEPLHFEVEDE